MPFALELEGKGIWDGKAGASSGPAGRKPPGTIPGTGLSGFGSLPERQELCLHIVLGTDPASRQLRGVTIES